jgi:hypothetical protein
MSQYTAAAVLRAQVHAKLIQFAEETHRDALTTEQVLNELCTDILECASPDILPHIPNSVREGERLTARLYFAEAMFAEEIGAWAALVDTYEASLDEQKLSEDDTLDARFDYVQAFAGMGRRCLACRGLGCHHCKNLGYFDEPEPQQLRLF